MKEISGERLYKNIQYFWVYRKGRPLEELRKYLGSRYTEYQSLPKIETVSNRLVAEYAGVLKTSVSRLRMNNKNRDGKIESINKLRANKYHLGEAGDYNETTATFVGTISSTRNNAKPKPDISSKKWNDNDAKKLRDFLEKRKQGEIDDSEFDRMAMK